MRIRCRRFCQLHWQWEPAVYLPLDQQLFNDNFAQFVVMTRDMTAREELKQRLEKHFANDSAAWRMGWPTPECVVGCLKTTASRLSGAIPRVDAIQCASRGGRRSRPCHACEPACSGRELRLERDEQDRAPGSRPGSCTGAGRQFVRLVERLEPPAQRPEHDPDARARCARWT